jgi:2-iminobutanoate/2-iminopropanoate deaminase
MPTDAVRIKTEPDFYAPFKIAQAYRVGDLLYLSGQAAVDDDGNIVGIGDFDRQAEKTFDNLARVLGAGGSDLSKIVKVNIYLKNMENFPKILTLRERYFTPPYPADTIVEVSSLALPELEIEIEAIALVDGEIID